MIADVRIYNRALTASEVILAGSGGTVPGTPSTTPISTNSIAYTNRWEIDSASLALSYTNTTAVLIAGATNSTYSIATVRPSTKPASCSTRRCPRFHSTHRLPTTKPPRSGTWCRM